MLTRSFAEAFAAAWIDAWNTQDLDRVLAHYAADFVFTSPSVLLSS